MVRSRQIRSGFTVLALTIVALLGIAAPAAAGGPSVVVAPGDTLWDIAAARCGSPLAWPDLYRGNPSIKDSHWIFPGQRITITCAPASRFMTRTPPPVRPVPAGGWTHPLPGSSCISGWGADRGDHSHKGVDLPAPSGTPIRAAHAGTVNAVKYQAGGAGWYVVLAHGGGIFTVYMHMQSRSALRIGASVAAGQTIGRVGSTGDATGPHLHFEVHRGLWYQINPSPFMRAHGVRVGC